MPVSLQQFGIDKLAPDERQELAELLWDSVELEPGSIPDWHIDILAERLEPSGEAGIPWEKVRERLSNEASSDG